MSKLLFATLFLGAVLCAEEMTGWISDSACGVANASASKSSRDCALQCIKGGNKAVFVSDNGQKVYQLSDSAKAAKLLDKKVKITGNVKGDTIEVSSIAYVN